MKKSKTKTLRAIEANVGTRNKFAKKLIKLNQDFQSAVLTLVLEDLENSQMLATDLSLTNPKTPEEIAKLKILQRKVLNSYARGNPEWVKKHIEEFVLKNIGKWMGVYDESAKKVCLWMARNLCAHVSASQRKAILDAGFPPELLKTRWSIPTVSKQYISLGAEKAVSESVKANTELITKMAAQDLAKLQDVITESLSNGATFGDIKKTLSTMSGFDERRAFRVALDQTNKLNQEIQKENARAIGVEKGIWVHVPGQYSSRETHIEMDGKEFDLDKGMYDRAVGKFVMTGELPFCRCVFRSLLPDKYLTGMEDDKT